MDAGLHPNGMWRTMEEPGTAAQIQYGVWYSGTEVSDDYLPWGGPGPSYPYGDVITGTGTGAAQTYDLAASIEGLTGAEPIGTYYDEVGVMVHLL